jgi:hypothetical protein
MAVDTTMAESISTEMTFNVFTMSLSASYVSNTVMATLPSASKSAPSAGFATTSRAVFTGSAGRQSVDYLLVAAFSALASMAVWA